VTTYRSLPFSAECTLKQRPDTVLAEGVPCSVWPTRSRVTLSGLTYDHEGEVPLKFYEVVRQANVVLVTGDEDYVVVDAQPNQYLPHVALMLRRSRPEGA